MRQISGPIDYKEHVRRRRPENMTCLIHVIGFNEKFDV